MCFLGVLFLVRGLLLGLGVCFFSVFILLCFWFGIVLKNNVFCFLGFLVLGRLVFGVWFWVFVHLFIDQFFVLCFGILVFWVWG